MITVAQGEWIADLGSMVCRNITNGIIVSFTKSGKYFTGKIKDMPMDVLAKWAEKPQGSMLIQKAVMDAEEVFMTAYFENDIE